MLRPSWRCYMFLFSTWESSMICSAYIVSAPLSPSSAWHLLSLIALYTHVSLFSPRSISSIHVSSLYVFSSSSMVVVVTCNTYIRMPAFSDYTGWWDLRWSFDMFTYSWLEKTCILAHSEEYMLEYTSPELSSPPFLPSIKRGAERCQWDTVSFSEPAFSETWEYVAYLYR